MATEAGELLAGAVYRDERTWERTAWLAAHIINIAGKVVKSQVTPAMLLGRMGEPSMPRDVEADFKELMRRADEVNRRKIGQANQPE